MDKTKRESILARVNKFFTEKGIDAEAKETEVDNKEKETYDFAKLIEFAKDKESGTFEKFVTELLVDGVTEVTIEPAIEVGAAIVLTSEDGTVVAAPAGSYELQDGTIIIVEEGAENAGVIAEITGHLDDEQDPEQELDKDSPREAKRIIESIVKEKVFVSTEDFNKFTEELTKKEEITKFLKEENEHLTGEIQELKKFVKETFETLLDEPVQEPAQTVTNPLDQKGANYLTNQQ